MCMQDVLALRGLGDLLGAASVRIGLIVTPTLSCYGDFSE